VNNVIERANELKDYSVNIRRQLHMYPEVSFEEFETSKLIKRYLDEMGIDYRAVTETGVIAEIKGNNPGKTVALRADMDAFLSIHSFNWIYVYWGCSMC